MPQDALALVGSVLHPTDFTPQSDRAFALALAIALIRQTELTLLHVTPDAVADVDWSAFPAVRRTMERWGLLAPDSPRSAVFEKFRTRVRKVAVRSRDPVSATVHYLEQHPYDLVVLASNGREGPLQWARPSRAEAIAAGARTMTLFVPGNTRRGLVSLDDGEMDLKNILVPVDTAPAPHAALAFACRAARILGQSAVAITTVHAGDSPPMLGELERAPDWHWDHRLTPGEPVAAILQAADEVAADMIVMTTAGQRSLTDALLGSTTQQVLRRAHCPVLAVPAD
jgi:nucleotide-binding universal stress UspA family protein